MPNENLELHDAQKPRDQQLAAPAANDMLDVIQRAARDPSVDMDKMERLLAMAERLQAKDAEKQFASAFVALQSEMPPIQASKSVPDKYGNIKYKFAPYESIMETLQPLLKKHGFTLAFSTNYNEGRVVQTCTVMHVGGHSRTNQFMARIGSGPPGSSEAQGDGAASTYAKRFAVCNAFNIITEQDSDGKDDARSDGEPISKDKAAYLRELVHETKSNEAQFFLFAGATSYDTIGSARYDSCVTALMKKIKV
jgi:hypothetical protein